MANNYYDATGVLVLGQVTAVIEALFGNFNLDKDYPGNGEVYIARTSEDCDPQWDDIRENLESLCSDLGLVLPSDADESIEEYLYALATHFGADGNVEIGNLIENHEFENSAELDVLYMLATAFDDGHSLKAMKIEGCWHSDRPRLFEFGGDGEYMGRHYAVCSSSTTALNLGENVDTAIEAGDMGKVAETFLAQFNRLLSGLSIDGDALSMLRKQLSDGLVTDAAGSIETRFGADDATEVLPGATRQEIAEVMMQDIVGDYDLPDQVPEWNWVEKNASFAHTSNGKSGIHEFVLNLSNHWDDIPEKLKPVINQARSQGMSYLILHQGT